MLNGFGYTIFGVPSRDLETTWRDVTEISKPAGQSPLLGDHQIASVSTTIVSILKKVHTT